MYFHEWNVFFIPIRISVKFVPEGPIDIKSALVQVIAWRTADKPLPDSRQAITWTNADPVHRRIYATVGGDELK